MSRLHKQEGSTLILLLGITAALAIAAASLLILLNNVQQNTYSEKTRVQAFNIAEGGIDAGMAQLSKAWPAPATPAPNPSFAVSGFRNEYSTTTFPNPASGSFIDVKYYDNSLNVGLAAGTPFSYANSPHYDANNDSYMYVEATARTGKSAARIQVKVVRTFWNPSFPRGIAVYAGGDLTSNGGGNNPKIHVDPGAGPPGGGTAAVDVYGSIGAPTVTDSSTIQANVGPAQCPPLDQVISPALIQNLKATAQQIGRYFSGVNAVANANSSPQSVWGGPGMQGLTVIEPPTGTSGTVSLFANTIDTPAVTVLLGGNNWSYDMRGNTTYYGFVYTEGGLDFAAGTPSIHGMIVAAGTVGIRGTTDIYYNDNVLVKLSLMWTLNVRLVPNTWRELPPN